MEHYVAPDGTRIAWYLDDFTDPWTKPDTVLLLHAAMGSSKRWFRWVPVLSRHYRVIRMDLRGHGESAIPRPDQPFSLKLLMEDALGVLDQAGCERAHVVGNSAGGYVAQRMAIEHPERLKSLALFGATPGLKNSHAPTWIPKIGEMGLRNFLQSTIHERFDKDADPNLVAWFIDQASSNDPTFLARFVLHMCTHDYMEELRVIRCPTLIVAAGHEPIGSAHAYEDMHQRIAGSELVYYDVTGHNICDGHAERCVAETMRFLSGLAGKQG